MAELTITAIAREAGVRPSTLCYYEKVGLLPLARRVAGRRHYDVCALKQLELIAYAKRRASVWPKSKLFRKAPLAGIRPPASGAT